MCSRNRYYKKLFNKFGTGTKRGYTDEEADEELEGFSKLYDGIDMVQLFSSLREYMEPAYMDSKDD